MRAAILVLLYAFAPLVQATPGGLDANGCHSAKTKGFHCHAPSDKMQSKGQGSAESREQREKRLRRECHARPNAGACRGFTR